MSAEIETLESEDAARGKAASAATVARSGTFLLLAWIVSAAYVLPFVDRGWIPHDDGTLAQSAERVLKGEVPHRDFDEGYTGGLSYLHAGAFALFGTSLRTLRFVLFGAFLVFVPFVYAIARRALRPPLAALVTFACVVWTVPNYFTSMPSWYNLFLAVIGAWAVLRHVESGRLVWLFFAGLCAGLSILVKVVGLYDVAAVLLFLAWRERILASSARQAPIAESRSTGFALLTTALAGLFVALLVLTVRRRLAFVDILHFIVPGLAVTGLLVVSEWRDGRGAFFERLRGIGRLAGTFLVGVAIPLAAFVAAYARAGGLAALWVGLFVRPQRQIETAILAFPEPSVLLPVAPYVLLLLFPAWIAARRQPRAALVLAGTLVAVLWAASTPDGYQFVWSGLRSLDVVAVVAGCVTLAARRRELDSDRSQRLFLLVALVACIGLIQFPFSAPIYFCYGVPFTILALAYLAEARPERVGWAHVQVLGFAAAFAVLYLNPGYIYNLGGLPHRYEADGRLSIDRAGLRIEAKDARDWDELVRTVREKSGNSLIYAGPEAPEVYFLCDRPNPTRIFFEGVSGVTVKGDTETLARLFARDDVRVVVWNHRPSFVHGLWRVYRESLWRRFPHSKEIGTFVVMWRD